MFVLNDKPVFPTKLSSYLMMYKQFGLWHYIQTCEFTQQFCWRFTLCFQGISSLSKIQHAYQDGLPWTVRMPSQMGQLDFTCITATAAVILVKSTFVIKHLTDVMFKHCWYNCYNFLGCNPFVNNLWLMASKTISFWYNHMLWFVDVLIDCVTVHSPATSPKLPHN
jgi:hypothetical protein